MLTLRTIAELRKYLETKRDMAKGQGGVDTKRGRVEYPENVQGMLYAYGEALRAIDALVATEAKERAEHDDKREKEMVSRIPWDKSA